MRNFKYTYTRVKPNGDPIEIQTGTITAHTPKAAKHTLVKRFGLQNWTPWRQTEDGKFVKTRITYDERGKITIETTGD